MRVARRAVHFIAPRSSHRRRFPKEEEIKALSDTPGVSPGPQEDKSALLVTARYGFAVAVPVATQEAGAGTGYPFSVLKAP